MSSSVKFSAVIAASLKEFTVTVTVRPNSLEYIIRQRPDSAVLMRPLLLGDFSS